MKLAIILLFVSSAAFAKPYVDDSVALAKILTKPEVTKELAGKTISDIQMRRADTGNGFNSNYSLQFQTTEAGLGQGGTATSHPCIVNVEFRVISGVSGPVYADVQTSKLCAANAPTAK